MRRLYTYQIVWMGIGMILLMLMVACTDDYGQEEEGDTLELLTYTKALQQVGGTRAVTVPSDYGVFTTMYPEVATENTTIGLFLTGASTSALRRIVYETDHWQSYVKVKDNENYRIFGFVPVEAVANGAQISAILGDYSRGAHLYINGLKSLSDRDVCMVVGVQGAETPDEDVDVRLGNFTYLGKDKGLNYVYLLFDHIYSAVQFSIRIKEDYASLRKIRMKSVVLKTGTSAVVNADVEIQPREQNTISSILFTQQGTQKGEFVLLDTERELTTSYTDLGHICYFAQSARGDLKLVTLYDVYDRYDNLVRENCTSENKLDLLSGMTPGQKRNIKLTLSPTYLHQLSEDDLDNPPLRIDN